MAGPIYAVQPGMGEEILIQVFVVIVIGGIGSIRGAFVGALIVGMVDTLGRAFLKPMLATVLSPTAADSAGPGARLDADLHPDGGRARLPARRGCSRRARMTADATARASLALVAVLLAARRGAAGRRRARPAVLPRPRSGAS